MAVTTAEPSRYTDMIRAAVVNSSRALRIRPRGFSGVSSGPPLISGITATPVSKPLKPNASLGKNSTLIATIDKMPWPATGGVCSKYQLPSIRL